MNRCVSPTDRTAHSLKQPWFAQGDPVIKGFMTTTPRDCPLNCHWSTVTYGTRPPHALLHGDATVVIVGASGTGVDRREKLQDKDM